MKTILVVDDDPISIRLIEMIVRRHGYETTSVTSAGAAWDWLDAGNVVEMVITDQNLGGDSGLDLCTRLRGDVRFRGVPIILCTGQADRDLVTHAMQLGVKHFIVKPIVPQILMDKVEAVAAERPAVVAPKLATMDRLQLSEAEYKSLVRVSEHHLAELRDELDHARGDGDRVTAVAIVGRMREPAGLLGASRLLVAIEHLERSRTWPEFDKSVDLALEEVASVQSALADETRPHLLKHPLKYYGPDAS